MLSIRKEKIILINRKYTDFLDYISKNPYLNIVEMDTVEELQKTNNGHEFLDVNHIECIHKTSEYVTHFFFCDPSASWQKGWYREES